MAETSWEAHARRRFWLWKWPPIILLAVIAAGIIIYNNRDVISGTAGVREKPDSAAVFSLAGSGDDRVAAGHVAAAVPEPLRKPVEPAPAARPEVKKGADAVERRMTVSLPSAVRKQREQPEKPKPAVPSRTAVDSVDIGEVPCSVLNRRDITVRIALVVYCDKAKRAEVVFKRDALAVVTRNAIRTRDLEEVRFDALEPELITSMNLVFIHVRLPGLHSAR